ncbi:hypothetical protein BN946_scf185007.g264 [Trametes cinnabarina]|uniref:Uncharacterized protein n=1 Tax=Pycnoporus cinnabarinus TaxID=5643 RepID=A0A060SLV4_PYCCI|nr:hypothetical protein BN946_scf185007.g264 [Trametes cinnabarina]
MPPPTLTSSLSPHVCILASPDVQEVLQGAGLPPLPEILQCFSPLPQITTRTTSLTSVPHVSFALRFSDVLELENAVHEDEEQRASRTMDWIGSRISQRCQKWVDMLEVNAREGGGKMWRERTPWWEEVKRCVEGDYVPSSMEGWNHPVSRTPLSSVVHSPRALIVWRFWLFIVILAVTTTAANPLQALQELTSRAFDFPPWVDLTSLRYFLIIHPSNSPLADPIAEALFNAVKKQYGLHSFLLPLLLPTDPLPAPVPVPALPPRLPTLSSLESPSLTPQPSGPGGDTITPAPTPPPHPASPMPHASRPPALTSRPQETSADSDADYTGSTLRLSQDDIQQIGRFVREFVTMSLVPWMEKCVVEWNENDILPLLSAPSPALALHADHALSTLRGPQPRQGLPFEAPAHAQYRALVYAVRWESGINRQDFLSSTLEGERWLVKSASSAEEPPTAILYAHAAFLSELKGARRRAALWYLVAAEKLEKTGIKPLAMYFFRKAYDLYQNPPAKELSPSFWDSEDRSPTPWEGFSAVIPAIEHELGRLLYTTGDTAGAVKYFLSLLKPAVQNGPQSHTQAGNGAISPLLPQPSRTKVFLEDFRVAFKHFKVTEGDAWKSLGLQLPVTFCQAKQTRVRFPGDAVEGDSAAWEKLEEDWATFWSARGKAKLGKSGKAAVNETFWVDLVLRNPLDVEVTLSGLTVAVREPSAKDAEANPDFVEVEILDDVVLGAQDTRTVEEASQRLHAHFVDDRHMVLAQGEYKHQLVTLTNSGTRPISELWVLAGEEDELWIDGGNVQAHEASSSTPPKEVLQSSNALAPRSPYRLSLEAIHSASQLAPGELVQLPFIFHAAHHGEQDLCILFVFRENEDAQFHCTRVTRRYEVKPILNITTSARPSASPDQMYIVNVEVENITNSSNIEVRQVSTMSASWECTSLHPAASVMVPPHQIANLSLGANPWTSSTSPSETRDFVARKLKAVLHEETIDSSEPPPVDLICTHMATDSDIVPLQTPATRHFIHCGRRTMTTHSTAAAHPNIPARLHRSIFPLYNPCGVDIVLFWSLPAQKRAGHVLVQGPTLGAEHAPLRELVEIARSTKVKRSMYAETQRERAAIMAAVEACEWNREADPVALFVKDGEVVQHDFRQGPCHVPLSFTVRNLSLTHPARATLRLAENPERDPAEYVFAPSDIPHGILTQADSCLLPPPYVGRLVHRTTLEPTQSYTAHAKLWATRPGCYALDSWTVEVEVGEPPSPGPASGSAPATIADPGPGARSAQGPWKTRGLRYLQRPQAGARPCVTVVDVGRLA